MNNLEQINVEVIDWEYIHKNCNLNGVRDSLFLFSRWFSRRFENIIFLMEEGYYFESLFSLTTLIENYLNSRTNENKKFRDIINRNINDETDNRILHEIRKLRNFMAHSRLIEYYVIFENDEKRIEYPLNEYSSFGHILNRIFVFCASIFDSSSCTNKMELISGITVNRYTISEIVNQYGYNDDDLDKIRSSIFQNNDGENSSEKEVNYTILRLLDNSSPVAIWQEIFSDLLEKDNFIDSKDESED